MISNDPLGTSPPPMSIESGRYAYPQDEEAPRMEHLEDLDYYAGDYIPGVEGEGRLSNVYDPNPHAQRRESGDPRGVQGDEGHAFEQHHDSLVEDLNQQDPDGFSPEPTPLPKIPLFVLSVVIFSEPLTSTILFPFVYFMVSVISISFVCAQLRARKRMTDVDSCLDMDENWCGSCPLHLICLEGNN